MASVTVTHSSRLGQAIFQAAELHPHRAATSLTMRHSAKTHRSVDNLAHGCNILEAHGKDCPEEMGLLRNQKKCRDQGSKLKDSHALLMDCTDHMYTSNGYKQSCMIDGSIKSIVSETQSRLVDSGLRSVESLNQQYKSVSTDVIGLKVETSKNVSVVYTRRSRRNSLATHITEGKDIVNHAEEHAMDACSKDLTARSKEPSPKMQNDKENTVLHKRTTRRKRDRHAITKDSEVFEIEVSTEFKHRMASSLSLQNEDGNTAASKPLRQRVRHVSVRESEIIEAEVAKDAKEQQVKTLVNVEPWTMLVHKKLQPEWTAYNPLTMRPRSLCDSSIKLLSWNVNGLRALLKRKGEVCESPILDLAQKEDFDVLCLQETKIQCKDVSVIKDSILPGYDNSYWNCSNAKLGYSGTAVLSRIKPLSVHYGLGVSDHDNEGRLITLEFESFYIVAGYIPNSGQKLERLMYRTQEWDPSLSKFLKRLEKTKPVILTGDLNCAHQEMDIYNPDGNRRSAGFTDEERSSFEANFLNQGLVDTFRKQHPHALAYTYWGYRTAARPKNQGWRLDYFLASEAIMGRVQDSYTLPYVGGSDHCPVGLILQV